MLLPNFDFTSPIPLETLLEYVDINLKGFGICKECKYLTLIEQESMLKTKIFHSCDITSEEITEQINDCELFKEYG